MVTNRTYNKNNWTGVQAKRRGRQGSFFLKAYIFVSFNSVVIIIISVLQVKDKVRALLLSLLLVSCIRCEDAAYCYQWGCPMVCVSVGHNHELYRNGWTDWDAVLKCQLKWAQGTMYYMVVQVSLGEGAFFAPHPPPPMQLLSKFFDLLSLVGIIVRHTTVGNVLLSRAQLWAQWTYWWYVYIYACMLAGQLVVINGGTETVPSGSAAGDGRATLDLRDSTLFFAGVPKNVYTSRSVTLWIVLAPVTALEPLLHYSGTGSPG